MRLLLDTHALLWWAGGVAQLSRPARAAIAEEANDVFVSAASAWEIATKHRLHLKTHANSALRSLPQHRTNDVATQAAALDPRGQLDARQEYLIGSPFDLEEADRFA